MSFEIGRLPFLLLGLLCIPVHAEESASSKLQLIRSGETREWDFFPEGEYDSVYTMDFEVDDDAIPVTLQLSQQQVKQRWNVEINGKNIATLSRNENGMVVYFDLPAEVLKERNRLEIKNGERNPRTGDDILIGRVKFLKQSKADLLNEAKVTITVTDQVSRGKLPARITILNERGELQTVGAESNSTMAVRPGSLYSSTGEATFGLPAGNYKIYAGRGFEYSLDTHDLRVRNGDDVKVSLEIERQVDTSGYVACDTHVHTLTHSGHGDSTIEERMITLAGEGVELPIATDHNVHIDHAPFAAEMNVSQYFTPVVGNEYTTSVGHFNIFPVSVDQKVPDRQLKTWPEIFNEVENKTQAQVVILNHARDLHSRFTPFGPENYLSIVGESLKGWPIGFNAMEVINSGATQTEPLELFHDWMNLLNAGHEITPVGSSDSHDVARHFVGQGRTYIQCADENVGSINIEEAVNAFLRGDVVVSYGLFTTLHIEDFESGDNENKDKIVLAVQVRSPDWIHPAEIKIFANGREVISKEISEIESAEMSEIEANMRFVLPKPTHDVCYVAIATGPGIEEPYWRTALPYQPKTVQSRTWTLGCSGAKWFDANKDGEATCARIYAEEMMKESGGDLNVAMKKLPRYDAAVASHVAHLYLKQGGSVESAEFQTALKSKSPVIQIGFQEYLRAWRESEIARVKQ
ncbi:CehA/McbA family metallohydrolase [Thalassoglobus polymorphus]|uniref:Uncharacterized protein n=1 Tax=Thalassoglobus polymorphus TaxID=2527994 RepID=A0A517QPX5_9PLAN|nr:CehA/McbA family metallohydrolase [Thalassoglobus polymorphus]QDT33690.1 hypothetical protein Mal48_29440 [Thalassoglobus polymorphus]